MLKVRVFEGWTVLGLGRLRVFSIEVMGRGDTMQKRHIFRKNEIFSKRSDGF